MRVARTDDRVGIFAENLGERETTELHRSVFAERDGRWADRPMHDGRALALLVEVRVGVGQRFENRHADVEDRIIRQPSAVLTKGRQELGEGDPVDVLEHQNELLVVLEEVVRADDVGVVELGADGRLAGELLDDVAVFGRRVRDQLEHDLARVAHRAFFARNERRCAARSESAHDAIRTDAVHDGSRGRHVPTLRVYCFFGPGGVFALDRRWDDLRRGRSFRQGQTPW